MITKILRRIVPKTIRKQLLNFKILCSDYGQYRTIKNWDCIDNQNKKIPWYTYPAIEYLSNLDFTQQSVFEYGSGNSSLWWSKKAKSVVSIEHDKEWYDKVRSSFGGNQTLLYKENNSEYEESITTLNDKYDVIIIDGIRRVECANIIEKYLNKESNEGCLVILDNSDWYKNTSRFLRESLDLIEVDFHGFGPINNYTWTTSIFVSRNFKFKPINNNQPVFSVAAIKNNGEEKC
jgi:hypothetical protein